MAPPLEVPVNLNPIVKEPPLFTDDPLGITDILSTELDTTQPGPFSTSSASTCVAYGNDEIYCVWGNDPNTAGRGVAVLEPDFSAVKRTYTINADGELISDVAINTDGNLVAYIPRIARAKEYDPTNGAVVRTINFNGFDGDNPFRAGPIIAPNEGEIIVYQINNATSEVNAYRIETSTGNVTSQTELNVIDPASFGSLSAATVINGNAVLHAVQPASANSDQLVVLDGYDKNIIKGTFDVPPSVTVNGEQYSTKGVAYMADYGYAVTSYVNHTGPFEPSPDPEKTLIRKMSVGDEGLAFIGNSDKTLATGKVYSFRIQGPNQTTTPTINDGGQGAKTVQLPGGVVVPLQSLTGNIDVYYDGDTYTVLTLTEGIAQAIYNYQDAVKDNMTATSDPTVNDDTDAGYSVRSRWYNTSTGEAFLAVDVTAGAAVWVKASLTLDELGSAATVESDQNLRTTDAVTHAQLSVTQWTAQASYTVAGLPTAGTAGRVAYASDGRKAGEGAGAGTGVLVFDDGANWIAVDTGAAVTA